MSQSTQYSNVIDTVEVNGCYLEEHRSHSERRGIVKKHYTIYERRCYKHRRHPFKMDIDI